MRTGIAVFIAALTIMPAAAQTAAQLPIAKGAWIAIEDQCSTAGNAQLYDGSNWGNAFYYINQAVSRDPQGQSARIVKVTKLRDGFTAFKLPDDGELTGSQVKVTGPGRMLVRSISVYSKGLDTYDENLKHCDIAQLSPRMQVAVRKFMPALAVAGAAPPAIAVAPGRAAAIPPAPVLNPNWGVQRTDKGLTYAFIARGTPKVRQMTIGCLNGAPTMIVELPGLTGRMTSLTVSTPEGSAATNLARQGNSHMWIGRFDGNATPRLLAGSATSTNVALGSANAGTISLAGSSQAIGTALSPCSAPQPAVTAPRAPAPVAAPAPSVTPVGPLAIAPGYYASSADPCQQATELFFYDGARVGVIDYDRSGNPAGLLTRPIGKPARQKDGSFWIESLSLELRKLSGGRIQLTIQDIGPPLRLCRREEIPPMFRAR